nr:MAG TPA: hypothetical protein [Caudoviricetes sp.]
MQFRGIHPFLCLFVTKQESLLPRIFNHSPHV